ncbi:hypothetical protein [Patiriisocius sp. Uisw_017]|jgi:hypothetical protein|uniref:hypothetical protein n=1 Tax=Patiriisocius sp. Uisw_017 TaxID=3230968 RepID=UPI0039EC6F16
MRTLFLLTILCLFSCKQQKENNTLREAEGTVKRVYHLNNPTQPNSQTPRLFNDGNHLWMSWITTKDKTDILYFSRLEDSLWKSPRIMSHGNDWFTNWADFPVISVNKGAILTSHLQKSAPDMYTYDIKLSLDSDSLKELKKNFKLHNDDTKSEHGFVSIVPAGDRGFFATWLDGRRTAAQGRSHDHDGGNGAMTLRSAFIDFKGTISQRTELDTRVCDCCQTSAAMTANGPVVVYRDRSDEEIRDMSIVRWNDSVWTKPKTVYEDHWKIAGCPVNGPAIAAMENNLAVVWFTENDDKPKVQVVFSEDGGATFGKPIRFDSHPTIGRVGVALISETEAVVSWVENVGDDTLVQLIKVESNGVKGEVVTLAKTSEARASGFPQISLFNKRIYLAMTLVEDKKSRVEMKFVGLGDL